MRMLKIGEQYKYYDSGQCEKLSISKIKDGFVLCYDQKGKLRIFNLNEAKESFYADDSFNCYGYDKDGYDKRGFNKEGKNRNGMSKSDVEATPRPAYDPSCYAGTRTSNTQIRKSQDNKREKIRSQTQKENSSSINSQYTKEAKGNTNNSDIQCAPIPPKSSSLSEIQRIPIDQKPENTNKYEELLFLAPDEFESLKSFFNSEELIFLFDKLAAFAVPQDDRRIKLEKNFLAVYPKDQASAFYITKRNNRFKFRIRNSDIKIDFCISQKRKIIDACIANGIGSLNREQINNFIKFKECIEEKKQTSFNLLQMLDVRFMLPMGRDSLHFADIKQYEPLESKVYDDLNGQIENRDESFVEMLLKKIDASGMTDSQFYKKANINPAHFNKIKNRPVYHIEKNTVVAFGMALELDISEMDAFLRKAGYALSNSNVFDIIILFCMKNKIYNINDINQILFYYDQKLLGAGFRA